MVSSRLPPTSALKAFVVTARSGSFTQAARDLNLTQSAVSQAVRGLEDQLGVSLFVRGVGSVELTAAGKTYRDAVAPALDRIADATAQTREAVPAALTIGCVRSVLNNWLLPRLPAFAGLSGAPDLHVRTFDREIRSLMGCDVAIVLAPKDNPPAGARHLHDEKLIAVAAPSRSGGEDVVTPGRPRIGRYWSLWREPEVGEGRGPVIQLRETSAQLAAARAGQGMALLPDLICYDDLTSGALVRLSPDFVSRGRAFFLLQAQPVGAPAADFAAWAEAQLEDCAGAAAFEDGAPERSVRPLQA
jgi:LysR family glycine cleavage system transcriptional activator